MISNKNPCVTRRCRTQNLHLTYSIRQKLENWNFGSQSLLVQLDGSRTQKFEILRVPCIQIPTMKGWNLSFDKQISTKNKSDGIFDNYLRVLKQN
jgi:hypothetical protein